MDVSGMRKSYERGELDEAQAQSMPLRQFEAWFTEAVRLKVPEPTAMTVATVDDAGRPTTRVVLMKGYDESGIVWYTNYNSPKGQHLTARPFAALQFHWVELERVVRIEGTVTKVSPEESDAYFAQRPIDSRIGAWASPQSQVIPSRATLVKNVAKVGAKYGVKPPRPDWWGGFRLTPKRWEFWQGRPSRLHDRLSYRLVDGDWQRERLAP